MIQKIVNIKAKANLKSGTIVQDLDADWFKGYCLSHNISLKIQTQSSNNKDFFYSEELKLKDPKPTLLYDNVMTKPAKKKDRKNKKKRFQKQKQEHIGE